MASAGDVILDHRLAHADSSVWRTNDKFEKARVQWRGRIAGLHTSEQVREVLAGLDDGQFVLLIQEAILAELQSSRGDIGKPAITLRVTKLLGALGTFELKQKVLGTVVGELLLEQYDLLRGLQKVETTQPDYNGVEHTLAKLVRFLGRFSVQDANSDQRSLILSLQEVVTYLELRGYDNTCLPCMENGVWEQRGPTFSVYFTKMFNELVQARFDQNATGWTRGFLIDEVTVSAPRPERPPDHEIIARINRVLHVADNIYDEVSRPGLTAVVGSIMAVVTAVLTVISTSTTDEKEAFPIIMSAIALLVALGLCLHTLHGQYKGRSSQSSAATGAGILARTISVVVDDELLAAGVASSGAGAGAGAGESKTAALP